MLWSVVETVACGPVLLYVAIVLVTLLYFKTRTPVPANIPPFPVRPYPIVGHIPMMSNNGANIMDQWAEKTGGIFSLYIGDTLYVVLNSFDILKEAFVKKSDFFSNRPLALIVDEDKDVGGRGIISTSGSTWKEQRTVSLSILRDFGMGKNWLAEKISEEVEEYLSMLSTFQGEPHDVRILTNTSVSNVVCAILIGKRFELDDPDFKRLITLMNNHIMAVKRFSILRVFPFLKYLPGDLFKSEKLKNNRQEINEHFSEKFIKEKDTGERQENPDCFINAYNNEMLRKNEAGQSSTLDHGNLNRVISNLFFAGTETTSTTLTWAMLYCLHYPDCQTKISKEIEEHIGYGRSPTIQDRPRLNYTNAFILESQRCGSIVPLGIAHNCDETVELAGYTIPKDTIILPNLNYVMKDAKTWGDPLVFRPERFLDKDNKVVVPEEFVPFSLGRRVCLGESLAKAELFLFFTGILQRFHLQPEDPDNLPPLEPVYGVTQAPKPFKVRFIPRVEES